MRVFLALLACVSGRLLLKQDPALDEVKPAACANVACGTMSCPPGFEETLNPGACCPVCFNPDIKLKSEVTGPNDSTGGKPSDFCASVWCFPTLCADASALQPPNTSNGQCCPVCKAE